MADMDMQAGVSVSVLQMSMIGQGVKIDSQA